MLAGAATTIFSLDNPRRLCFGKRKPKDKVLWRPKLNEDIEAAKRNRDVQGMYKSLSPMKGQTPEHAYRRNR